MLSAWRQARSPQVSRPMPSRSGMSDSGGDSTEIGKSERKSRSAPRRTMRGVPRSEFQVPSSRPSLGTWILELGTSPCTAATSAAIAVIATPARTSAPPCSRTTRSKVSASALPVSPRASAQTRPASPTTSRGAWASSTALRSAGNAAPVGQLGLQRQTKLMARDGDRELGVRVPTRGTGADTHHDFLCFGRIAERRSAPAVTVRQDARRETEARECDARRERDERGATLARGAGQANGLSAQRLDAGEDEQRKAAAAEQLLGGA